MSSPSDPVEQYALITRRLERQNDMSCQKLQQLLGEGKSVRYLWPTAPTGKPHIGYLIPLIKFADFVRAGGEVIVELIDTYSFLVNYKYPWDQVRHRTIYYRSLVLATLSAIGVPMSKVSAVEMSSYQGTPQYMTDFWKMCAFCTQQDTKDTGEEVGASTMLGPLLTPLVQELATEYLSIDVEFGGTDQRGIFDLGERCLPALGYEKRAHFMNKLLPSLTGGKMSSSHPAHTKIMFLDDADEVRTKIDNASCLTGVAEGNGVLPIAEHILFPISEVWAWEHEMPQGASSEQTRDRHAFIAEGAPAETLFSVTTGGPSNPETSYRHFVTYRALEQEYLSGIIQPQDLKHAVAKALNAVLEPIRSAYAHSEEWKQSDRMGYPEDWPSE